MSTTQSTSTNSHSNDTAESARCVRSGNKTEPLDPPLPPTIDYGGAPKKIAPSSYRQPLTENYRTEYATCTINQAVKIYRERLRNGGKSGKLGKHKRETASDRCKRFCHTDRILRDRYDNPHTVLVSLRLSPTDSVNERIPPILLYNEISKSVTNAMNYASYTIGKLGEFERARVIAGTDHWGTPHAHILYWVDGEVSPGDLSKLVDRFVTECRFAPDSGEGNRIEDGAVTVRGPEQELATDKVDERWLTKYGACSKAAQYLSGQIPHYKRPDNMNRAELLFGATVDASHLSPVSFSSGCWSKGDDEPRPS